MVRDGRERRRIKSNQENHERERRDEKDFYKLEDGGERWTQILFYVKLQLSWTWLFFF